MTFSEFFIRRPIFSALFILSILISGLMSYRALPINVLPNMDFPTILVSATLPGADPDTMATSIALPLEKQFSAIAGIDSMSSVSTNGTTQLTLQFAIDRDIDGAAQDVQAAISSSLKQLPTQMLSPPTYRKLNPAESPVFYLALTSDTLALSDIDYYAETIIAQRLSMVNGVAQVQVYGSQAYAVRIQLDPASLYANNIGLEEIASAVSQNNVNLPTGSLYGQDIFSVIKAPGQLFSAAEFENLILSYHNGSPLFLKNIGKAVDDVANNKVAAWRNDKRGIILAIQKQPNTNTIEVIDDIKNLLPKLREQIPAGVNIDVVFDRSESIRSSVNDVKFTLILALILVVIVIFGFFRKVNIAVIPLITLPLSIIGTFAVMYMANFNIDNLSLMALTLTLGFVIDDSIIVLENVIRHYEQGKSKIEAAIDGSKQIFFTVISMTLSLVAVFIPLLFIGGILGQLLHEFAITLAASILISCVISLTITPMLCNLLLNKESIASTNEPWFVFCKEKYASSLKKSFQHKPIVILVFFLTLITTVILFKYSNKGLLPDEDLGQILCTTEADQNISFDAMIREQNKVALIAMQDPNVDSLMSSVGGGGRTSLLNLGTLFIKLKPRESRQNMHDVILGLRKSLAEIPGIKSYMQPMATITIGGQVSSSQYQYTLQGINQQELYSFAQILQAKLKSVAGIVDLTSDLKISQPQVYIEVDRNKAAELGVTMQQVQNTLYFAYGSQQISTIYTSGGQYQVILELEEKFQRDKANLSLLHIKSSKGILVALDAIATITDKVGPASIAHLGQLPAVTISFNLLTNYSLSQIIPVIEDITQTLNMPSSITASFQGSAAAFQSSVKSLGILIVLAILVIYILLGMLYESFIHPLTILSGLPSAGVGALVALMIFNKPLDLYGFIGLIMLIGIVKKNAIMIIDFALELQRTTNKSTEEAIYEACIERFRPIMMTTLAAIMGSLPIALAFGATGPQRSSLGIAVVGGLMISQFLTLFITPVIFIYFERFKDSVYYYINPSAKPSNR